MKPELGRSYPPSWRGVPAHMSKRDVALWYRFLDAHGPEYQAFFYDTALGDGTDPGPDQADAYRFGFIRITRLRADAVGVRPVGWTIFEVRPAAGAGAFGAITTYLTLWKGDPPDGRPVDGILITDVMRDQVRAIVEASGVRVLIV